MAKRVAVPKTVHIEGKRYALIENKELPEGTVGLCSPGWCKLHFWPSQDPQQVRDTLLHESLHALLYELGLAHELDNEVEERICRRLAYPLRTFLLQNPKLTHFLLSEDD